ncbi:DUF6221 family protein [Streptomyces sp. NPDC006975]|uniref:DUF6221 family protein n=1 Tax=Streptomyces sp. NPDC006975 TaxID=3154310 RepID=UPI003456A997
MTDDLVQFLRARLDEDEALAREAPAEPWHIGNAVDPTQPCHVHTFPGARMVADRLNWLVAEHIARHDPVRVLRDVGARREIVAAYLPPGTDPHPGLPCINYEGQDPADYDDYDSCSRHLEATKDRYHTDRVLRLLALTYADHPDYREEWRP